ncbi:hypothetical protein OG762_10130 [Streptomyces sp. NBC_01136]|nr:hypothetical protein OG762_10130 [Streptomyces sp. NBC_01136]
MGEGNGKGMVLHIRTADLKRAAPDFHEGAKNLSTALTTLVTTLDGLGKPWGDDKQGKEFGDTNRLLRAGGGATRHVCPQGDTVVLMCTSTTAWNPAPDTEEVSHTEAEGLLVALAHDFKVALERACPQVASSAVFVNW